VKLTARIATMLRTAGTSRVDSVGAGATPRPSSRAKGSGAPLSLIRTRGLFGLACLAVLAATAAVGAAALPATAAEACPNQAQRAENNSLGLPECRAYEQVSAAFKNGFTAFAPVAYTEDGSAFKYVSPGVFAGVGLGSTFNSYVATRSDQGWDTTAGGPAGPTYEGGYIVDRSADLQSSLWQMRLPDESSGVDDFYLRRPDGSFSRIGPTTNPASLGAEFPGPKPTNPAFDYYGASADLSHVIYSVGAGGNALFPGDTTKENFSLYEYVGTGNEHPRLVGLDNSGQLVSDCGTLLGSAQTKYGSISTDGEVLFFTAQASSGCLPADELWARVGGTTSYEASKSICTRTAADPGGACNAPAPALFQGAALDGSRVYFTTTQQLVDGDTDETNDLYAYDLPTSSNPNPSPALVEVSAAGSNADVQGVLRVSDDGSRVYFVAKGVLAGNNGVEGVPAASGEDNLYVWERDASHPSGQMTFVSSLLEQDAQLWANEGGGGRMNQITPDGRYLVMSSFTPLVETDTDTAADMYRYDADTGQMVRLSTDTSGAGGNGEFDANFFANSLSSSPAGVRLRTTMSAAGSAVIFDTSEALAPADVNGVSDVYLWKEGHVSLISDGTWPEGLGAQPVTFIDGSGEDIYFPTSRPLSPSDADTTSDFYDARVHGGFSFPAVTPCSGEACQSPVSGPPTSSAPATDRPNGSGNVKPKAQHCTKGQVMHKGQCVKKQAKKHHKKSKKHHKKSKRASANRGGAK
jgi:hypothetical protein